MANPQHNDADWFRRTVGKVLRGFHQGALCPALVWEQMAEVLSAAEGDVRALLDSLPPGDRGTLRDLFDERPLSFGVLDDHPLWAPLTEWCLAR